MVAVVSQVLLSATTNCVSARHELLQCGGFVLPTAVAALDAGRTRIRPVLMMAAAMVVGMIPMAIGGPGKEQNAALARAVIGELLLTGEAQFHRAVIRRPDGTEVSGG
jgi:Cu/Ag efflux pump CusA